MRPDVDLTSAAPAEGLQPESALPAYRLQLTPVGVFLFAASYWAAHRIHYDPVAAAADGFAGPVVPGPLLVGRIATHLCDLAGDATAVRRLRTRFVSVATVDDDLVLEGRVGPVVRAEPDSDRAIVDCDLVVHRPDDSVVLVCRATVRLGPTPDAPSTHAARRGTLTPTGRTSP